MINEVGIENFKRFRSLTMNLGALTLLTGVNSGGKSSLIQALLIAHVDQLERGAVPLNGPYGLALGEASDVLNRDAESNELVIALEVDGQRGHLSLRVPDYRSPVLEVADLQLPPALTQTTGQDRGFTYLSAERLGPRDLQEIAVGYGADLTVGVRGEFTAHLLSELGRNSVNEARQHPDTAEEGGVITLAVQTELWMSSIVSPVQLEATWLPATSAARVRFRPPDLLADWLRPGNVGFGLSYTLPIVTAGLTSPPSGMLIVENPEAHLHPAGQSEIGSFLARVAASGVQVVVETHSDHVLAGVRRSIGVDHILAPEDLVVGYFSSEAEPAILSVDERGSLSGWPDGFFDQTEKDLAKLARSRRVR